jgi:hypothetical protein
MTGGGIGEYMDIELGNHMLTSTVDAEALMRRLM